MKEEWRDVVGYENYYMVSNFGRVRSKSREIIRSNGKPLIIKSKYRKLQLHWNGYNKVKLIKNGYSKGFYVHRLVAMAFIPNPKNLPYVNHKNEIKNDNNCENLEWCTMLYNNTYKEKAIKVGIKNRKKVNQIDLNGNFIKCWISIREASFNGFDGSTITKVCKGKKKTHKGYRWEYAH